ncbi:MAG: carbonic anhydrase, partial [Draconibacterium sp.]|nr:carbonic anhydrase [Draconibacterium sp.]
MTAQEILNKLSAGNKRFATDQLNSDLQDSSRRKSIVSGQKPFATIFGCADSRIVPELIFDTGLGELFVVR